MQYAFAFGTDETSFCASREVALPYHEEDFATLKATWLARWEEETWGNRVPDHNSAAYQEEWASSGLDGLAGFWVVGEDVLAVLDAVWDTNLYTDAALYWTRSAARRVVKGQAVKTVLA